MHPALWPLIWTLSFIGKHLRRPYRWLTTGPEQVGKSSFRQLLKNRLNSIENIPIKRTKKDGKKLETFSLFLKDASNKYLKIKLVDYTHKLDRVAKHIFKTWPTDFTLIFDLETCVRGYNKIGAGSNHENKKSYSEVQQEIQELLDEANSIIEGEFKPPLKPDEDPIVLHIQAILSGLTTRYYRENTAEWGKWPGTLIPWKWLRRENWDTPIKQNKRVKNFYIFFNKADQIPKADRERIIRPFINYYSKYLLGSVSKPTYLYYLHEEEGMGWHVIATSLKKNWYVGDHDFGDTPLPVAKFMAKIADDKEV